ncbi:hypothetical protein RF11_01887 [Thelohanellus kitauei]|uniref:Uncharacterized protein n=1 Tax=Thelohanellus kitauei TaxID=669202 RepID=A0A0C2M8G3_THEKT|nr:hypothetical protein RF11_01887 [Thelohanellus kitauei]
MIIEEAGDAYFEAAELAAAHLSLIKYQLWAYEKSADIYIQIKSIKALFSFRKVIDYYLKKENINKAIERCAEYGHRCKNDLGDAQKSEEFYNQVDELRRL